MGKIATLIIAAFCFVGCDRDFHDPLLRQQLTTVIADIADIADSNNVAAQKALGDVDAILSVNAAKLSVIQKQKLTSARDTLNRAVNLYETKLSVNATNEVTNYRELYDEYGKDLKETQKLITEAASTF